MGRVRQCQAKQSWQDWTGWGPWVNSESNIFSHSRTLDAMLPRRRLRTSTSEPRLRRVEGAKLSKNHAAETEEVEMAQAAPETAKPEPHCVL